MNHTLRWLFFTLIVHPVILIVIGLNLRHGARLPSRGPAIVVANHNSHLDTLVLMTLLPRRVLPITRPVAAMDYFMRNRLIAWFATRIIGIIPIARRGNGAKAPLQGADEALHRGEILILYPEGTRGEPEHMSRLKKGVAHLAGRHPQIPVVPVYLHGLGKALPKGEALLVPFFCDVYVGEPLHGQTDIQTFMQTLEARFVALRAERGETG